MNKNLYPRIALFSALVILLSDSFAATANTLVAETPATSFISKPANNATEVGAPVLKITANVVTGETRYTIQISTLSDFSSGIIEKTSSKDNERTMIFTGLQYATTYYARAKTTNTPYGRVSQFSTKAEVFPFAIEPSNGSDEANPVILKVRVSPITDATSYTLEINSKNDFTGTSRIAQSSIKGQTEFIFKDLKYGATYFARVKSDVNTTFGATTRFITRKQIAQKRLWGMTTSAGAYDGGTIFSLSVDSATFTKHHDYIESGEYPNAYLDGSLIHAADGGFYGNSECTRNGTCGNGEIFHVSPLGEFSYVSKPYIHEGSVMLASNNNFYVVDDWINYFQGGIIRMPVTESEFELSHVLFRIRSRSQGQNIRASLIELPDGYLYGVAPYGGSNNHGVIYKIKLDGTDFQVIYNFNQPVTGAFPQSQLLAGSDGYLYGTTYAGGQFNQGTLYKILPDGNNFTKLIDFSASTGSQPHGAVVEKNKRLYGTAPAGGANNHGVVYSINLDGTGFKTLFSFNGVNGDSPLTTPTIVENYIYGMTTWGGLNGNGVIFKMKLDGTSFEKLHDFTSDQGANPTGALLLSEDFFPAATPAFAENTSERINTGATYSVGVFPNPFVNSFTAEISSSDGRPARVLVTDLHGQVISEFNTEPNATLSMGDDLRKGIYILKVIKGKEVTSHRIVKK
jgi:uncharacterized repeat protein (TIGR03803 family)